MSKAFTRESDEIPEVPLGRPATPATASRNYLTPDGAHRFREELKRLVEIERPPLAALAENHGDDERGDQGSGEGTVDAEAGEKLRMLDERIQRLRQTLRSAVVLHPPIGFDAEEKVRFGSWVKVRAAADGRITTYRLVGTDETDVDRGWVSWISPVARALQNAHVGDRVQVQLPGGSEELEILSVRFAA